MKTARRNFITGAIAAGTSLFTGNRATNAQHKDPISQIRTDTVKWSRDIPVYYEADVAVIGGGIAGVSAACAAAKSGAKVMLVERFAVTGGMLTTGGVANFCGQMTGQGEVFDAILSDLRKFNALGYKKKESVFHYEILAIVLQELLLRRGVKLLLHTRFVSVVQKGKLITRANAIKIKIPMFDSTNTESLTKAEIRARRRMMEVLHYHQRVEKRPWLLDHCSPIIGIREGCRILGDYVLKVDDLRAGRQFDDAVARGTFYLDGHKPDDDKRTYILPKDQLKVPPYQIPLRCLIARDGKNLWMAGRCFSADQLALSSARVSTTGSMMGQAAGIAAALCAKKNCNPRDLDYGEVRKIVELRGAKLAV